MHKPYSRTLGSRSHAVLLTASYGIGRADLYPTQPVQNKRYEFTDGLSPHSTDRVSCSHHVACRAHQPPKPSSMMISWPPKPPKPPCSMMISWPPKPPKPPKPPCSMMTPC